MSKARRILKNMLSLSAAEIANKGIALVTMAYLARVLLPDGFGIIGWANSFTIYFIAAVNLGFEIVGSREVAKNPGEIRKYVNNILSIKISTALALYALLGLIVFLFVDKPLFVKWVVMISGLNLFAHAVLLNWAFKGIEKMEIIALRQAATSVLNLVGILILVHSPSDIAIAMSVTVGSMILNSLWMLLYYVKLFGRVRFEYNYDFWKKLLSSSIPISLNFFIISINNYLNMFLLGLMRSDYETGIYNAGFKVLAFSLAPSGILQNAFFPQLSRSTTTEERRKVTEKYALLTFLAGTIISCGIFVFSDYVIDVGFGDNYGDSVIVLQLLMVGALVTYLNVTYSAPLLSWNLEKYVVWAMGAGCVINLIFNLILIPKYGAMGAAIATVLTETAVLIGLAVIMWKTIKKVYVAKFLVVFLYAAFSCAAGYFIMQANVHPLIAGSISLVIFIFLNFIFKTITIAEIKMYLNKQNK